MHRIRLSGKLLRSCRYASSPHLLNQNSAVRQNHYAKKVDPFGFENEDEEEILALVKGVYSKHHPLGKNSERLFNDKNEGEADEIAVDIESKYQHLPLTNVEKQLTQDKAAEKVYESQFGMIRLDSDNLVNIHGQYDEENVGIDDILGEPLKEPRPSHRTMRENPEDYREEIEQLKKNIYVTHRRRKDPKPSRPNYLAEQDAEAAKEVESLVSAVEELEPKPEAKKEAEIDEMHPKTAAEYVKLQKMKEKAAGSVKVSIGGKTFDVGEGTETLKKKKVVPEVYLPVDYYNMTHEDVWEMLEKRVCFQNDFLIAFNKPRGLPMHTPSTECRHLIIEFLKEMAELARVPEVFPCHRLDKDTTGILLFAKSQEAADVIRNKFKTRSIEKQYFAITKNAPEIREATIRIPIGEAPMRKTDIMRRVLRPDLQKFKVSSDQRNAAEAITKYKVLESREWAALLDVRPVTGVTHQIRVHLSRALGCPILGDHKYSHTEKMAPQRLHDEALQRLKIRQSKVRHLPLHLHCSKMEFNMPDGFLDQPRHEPIFIHARPPFYFLHTLKALGLKR